MIGPAWETRQLLFVYGTLLLPTGDAGVDAAVAAGRPLGEAYMRGILYDLGEYPGAIALPSTGTPVAAGPRAPRIRGRLLGFPDPETAFARLDWYEGYGPGAPHAGEFTRALTEVTLAESGETLTAQVYLYALSAAGRTPIPDGDYLAYRRRRQETGRQGTGP